MDVRALAGTLCAAAGSLAHFRCVCVGKLGRCFSRLQDPVARVRHRCGRRGYHPTGRVAKLCDTCGAHRLFQSQNSNEGRTGREIKPPTRDQAAAAGLCAPA